jgi:hypothetical protein
VGSVDFALERLAAAARAVSTIDLGTGVRTAPMSIMGIKALVCYRMDAAEDTRRRRMSAGPIVSADVLDLLLGLPLGLPVPVAALTRQERGRLARAPHGAVSVAAGQAVRRAVAPVTVQLALVPARSWRRGLVTASRFAPFCSRAMVLPAGPADPTELQMEADFYGIGVVVARDRKTEVLVEPEPFRRRRFTAAGWQFLEEVYRLGR